VKLEAVEVKTDRDKGSFEEDHGIATADYLKYEDIRFADIEFRDVEWRY
jgi:hypothetical protein